MDHNAMQILQLHQAERAIHDFPGRSTAELADAIGADRDLLRERLLDLESAGRAHRRGFNTCRVTGKPSAGWHAGPVPKDESTKPGAEVAPGFTFTD